DEVIGQSMHIDHIDPSAGNDPDNLCLACPNCNLSKAKAMTGVDPETGNSVALFNPRLDSRKEHFEWIDDGGRLRGITDLGRGTISRLKVNKGSIVRARVRWVQWGVHPPDS